MIDFRMFKMTKTQRLNKIEEILRGDIESHAIAYFEGGMCPNKRQLADEEIARKRLILAIDTLMEAQK
jgi:hypothetical protein